MPSEPAPLVVHPEWGVYVGNAMGMAFWSMLDAAAQDRAVAFADEEDARSHVATWVSFFDPDGLAYVPVGVEGYATCDDLDRAGLGDVLGELRTTVPACGQA